jgi:hypothetical protein
MTQDDFTERMVAVWAQLKTLQEQEETLTQQMDVLTQQGVTNATIHIRSDNGGMELLHPTGSEYERSTGRRREYIGKKPEAQEQAQARVERYHSCQSLYQELNKTREKIRSIHYHMGRLEMAALGTQAKPFSELGTKKSGGPGYFVPKDWNWLTPQMVIDYFKSSPDLAAIAGDVQDVLGKMVWAEQKAA